MECKTFDTLAKILVLLVISVGSGCAGGAIPVSQISHPDEVVTGADGTVQFIPNVTGEDVIKQVRGNHSYCSGATLECANCTPPFKLIFYYKIDSMGAFIVGGKHRLECIMLIYDSNYGVYTYRETKVLDIDCLDLERDPNKYASQFLKWYASLGGIISGQIQQIEDRGVLDVPPPKK